MIVGRLPAERFIILRKNAGPTLARELKKHAPFTLVGALSGVVLLVVLRRLSWDISYRAFYTLHPMHVFFSGLVTASLYRRHRYDHETVHRHRVAVLLVGFIGAIGVATLSDSIIPFAAEWLLHLPDRELHLGFVEKWWLVNPLAVAGAGVALVRSWSRLPHAGHVLLSTYASLFHIMMALDSRQGVVLYAGIFVFLFLTVWLPGSLSDVIFPVAVAETSAS